MHYDFSQVEDTQSFVSIPEGTYECRIAEVREGLSRDGSVRWSFRLEVLRGEYAGRTAGWDALTWSERGIARVKRTLACFGLDVSGEIDLESSDLVGLGARASFEFEEREDPQTGRRVVRLRVPYAGYAPLNAAPGDQPSDRGALDSRGSVFRESEGLRAERAAGSRGADPFGGAEPAAARHGAEGAGETPRALESGAADHRMEGGMEDGDDDDPLDVDGATPA